MVADWSGTCCLDPISHLGPPFVRYYPGARGRRIGETPGHLNGCHFTGRGLPKRGPCIDLQCSIQSI